MIRITTPTIFYYFFTINVVLIIITYKLKLKYISPWLLMWTIVKVITFHHGFWIQPWWNCLLIYNISELALASWQCRVSITAKPYHTCFLFFFVISSRFIHKSICLLPCSFFFVYVVFIFHMIFIWFSHDFLLVREFMVFLLYIVVVVVLCCCMLLFSYSDFISTWIVGATNLSTRFRLQRRL